MTTTYVYHLVDPTTRTVRYVGKTATPRSRLRGHIADAAKRQNTAKKRWIHNLAAKGLVPVLVIVSEHADEATARQAESAEVHRHLATIYNQHDPAKGAKDLRRA